MQTVADRFWKKVRRRGPEECWYWKGAVQKNGYGCMSIKDRVVSAHRISWELANGTIPAGMLVVHLPAPICGHRLCVNPAHLKLSTLQER